MNLGQLLEAHLGWAAERLNMKLALPAFEKLSEEKIFDLMKKAGLPVNGKEAAANVPLQIKGVGGTANHEKRSKQTDARS